MERLVCLFYFYLMGKKRENESYATTKFHYKGDYLIKFYLHLDNKQKA